jgi:hypothetical protein
LRKEKKRDRGRRRRRRRGRGGNKRDARELINFLFVDFHSWLVALSRATNDKRRLIAEKILVERAFYIQQTRK